MRARYVITFCMSGVKSVSLPRVDHFLGRDDLVRILAAAGSSEAHFVIFNIKKHVVLPQKRPSKGQVAGLRDVDSHAVAVLLLAIEVLTRVPVERDRVVVRFVVDGDEPTNDRERFEILLWAIRELLNIITEAKVPPPVEVHPALAVVFLIHRAEPFEVLLDYLVKP